MHRSPLMISAVMLLAFNASASDTLAQPQGKPAKKPATQISTFEVRAYPDYLSELQVTERNSKLHSSGMVIDYYPFEESGFRVSAGAYGTDQNPVTDAYSSVKNKTYLGVGWKRLLDDASRFDVSVEVGAFFGEENVVEAAAGNNSYNPGGNELSDGFDALESAVKTVRPVISFGIQYRF